MKPQRLADDQAMKGKTMFSRPEREKVKDGFDFSKDVVTKQSFKEECDIHNILSQYRQTGVINHLAVRSPDYADVSDYPQDYQVVAESARSAAAAFADLPEAVRRRYHDDPATFLQALVDPAESSFLVQAGILNPAPAAGAGAPPASGVGGSTPDDSKAAGGF